MDRMVSAGAWPHVAVDPEAEFPEMASWRVTTRMARISVPVRLRWPRNPRRSRAGCGR